MRGFFDWMTGHVEPYVSFRFLLALVFVAMFVHWCIVGVLTVRDFIQQTPARSERERQAGRIARNAAALILLFVLVHLLMVLLSGVWNNIRSMITGKYRIEEEEKPHAAE